MRDAAVVEPRWLLDHLADAGLRVLDVRVEEVRTPLPDGSEQVVRRPAAQAYACGHIPGAVFVSFTDFVHDDGVAARVVPAGLFEQLVRRLGIDETTHVVIYDADGGSAAARLWWTFRLYGHERVSVLDGGWLRWVAEGHPQSREAIQPEPGRWRARLQAGWWLGLDEVRQLLQQQQALFVDTRNPEQFQAGHLPGAVNVPAAELRRPDGYGLKSPEELRPLLEARGVPRDRDHPVVVYCRTGMSAAVGVLQLHRLGYRNVGLYVGSWNEWQLHSRTLTASG